MAGIKIHQYPLERLTFGDDDYYDIDYWDGAAYQTAKIKGSTIKDAIRSGILTIYSDNGSLTENRTVDIAGFNLAFTGGSVGMGDDLTVFSTDAAKPFVGNFINSNGDAVLYVANTGDNVGIGTSAPESDAKLDIESTSKGILIPRMTTTERGSITLATFNESMIIYNTTTNQFEYIDSTLNWVPLGGGAEALDDLTDVTTGLPVTPTEADDGRLLFYDYDAGEWITDDTVNHGTVVINCKKSTAGTIAKGLPVYLVGFDADLHTVELADASSTNTMPVIGFTAEPLNDTDSKHLTTFGKLTGIDTTSTVSTLNPNGETWAVNDALYMSTTAGGLTKVRPTGATTQIQRIAKVLKVDATGGQIFVFNTARTAGLPNLGTDKLWIGDANGIPQEVDKSTIGGATGVAAIYDATGTPTFYADLSSAITAASSGDTVFLFADINETGTTEIILKNGVDINLNGFTYEMSNASTTLHSVTDNNVSVDVTIYNGVIKRSGASGNSAIALDVKNSSSKIKLEGVEVQSTFGYCIYNQGIVDGGKTSNTAGNFAVRNEGRMSNLINDGYGEYRQAGTTSEGYNIYSKASNYYGMFIDNGKIQNSYAESASNEAFFIQGGTAENCIGVSSASYGIRTNGAIRLNNCKGYSTAAGGIFMSSSGAKAYYCIGESTANIGILINNGINNAGLHYCTGRSSASQGIRVDNGSRAINCTGISTLNTTSGHGFDIRSNNDRVSGCYAEVTNAGAYGFQCGVVSPYLVDCRGRGMTTLINSGGNSQTNTADAYGNILLD